MNPPFSDLPEPVRALLLDPVSAARDGARHGARVIGYLGQDVPVALILAAGALPLRLRGVPKTDTARADRYLESAYLPEHRLIVEQWIAGELDFLEAVVFPRADDSAQRLYYYLGELQRRRLCAGPRAILYETADIDRFFSREYTRESTHRLAAQLGVDVARLPAASRRVSERETLLADLRALRTAVNPLPGSLAWALERAAGSDWRDSFAALARQYLAGAPAAAPRCRLLLAGNATPDDALHRAIESARGSAVAELGEAESGRSPPASASLDAIAEHFHARRSAVRSMRENAQWLVERARAARADAVIAWLIEEDESLPWEISRQMRNLESAGIPALLMPRQCWRASDASLQEVRRFVASLEKQS